MDQATITSETRRWLQQNKAITVSDTAITAMTLRGVQQLWLILRVVDPDFVRRRISLSSNTNIFALPSDCMSVNKVWSMQTNAGTVTGTSDVGGEVNLEIVDHGFEDDMRVKAHDVGGTTEANGDWNISVVDDDNFTLDGSTYSSAWTSGGKVYQEKSSFSNIGKINTNARQGVCDNAWFLQGKNIVVDKIDFSYDIIIDYEIRSSALTDIPEEYHEGLISFNFLQYIPLMRKPLDEIEGNDRKLSVEFHSKVWNDIIQSIKENQDLSTEPINMEEGVDFGDNYNDYF